MSSRRDRGRAPPTTPGHSNCGGAAARAPPPSPRTSLLDHLALGGVALGLGHLLEVLALAGVLTLARIVGGLAGGLAFTGVDSRAFHLAGIGGARRRDRGGREHHRSGGGKGD